nr:GTP-binding protein [uncultured Mogibacterium sp.]
MKILIISGFLGAGKTTFIKAMSNTLNRDFVILENEYASLNVDEDILKKESGLNVWELTEKCICCSGKTDFALNILTIANSIAPEHLIVEPTGVGYLSKVINNISQIEYEQIEMLAPITIIDPNRFFHHIEEYRDLLTDQIKCADTIILSKCDKSVGVDIESVVSAIKAINGDANIISKHYGNLPQASWEEFLLRKRDGSIEIPEVKEETEFESISVPSAELPSIGELVFFLEDLIRKRYGNIIRAKGTIEISDTLVRFDISDGNYAISQAYPSSKKGCVFIGDDIKTGDLRIKLLPISLEHPSFGILRKAANR